MSGTHFIFSIVLWFSNLPSVSADTSVIGDPNHPEKVTGSLNPLRYSEGYAMGILANLKSTGVVINTLEGDLKLGHLSSKGGIVDNACVPQVVNRLLRKKEVKNSEEANARATRECTLQVNPWHFSNLDEGLLRDIRQMENSNVAVFFRSYFWIPFVDSDNYLIRVYPVNRDILKVGDFYESDGMVLSRTIPYQKGYIDGRVVKASLDGVIRKAHEVLIQQGAGGDVFSRLSVDDNRVFDFIVKAMLSDRFLRIHYVRMFSTMAAPINAITGYDTSFRVFRVDIIDDPTVQQPAVESPR